MRHIDRPAAESLSAPHAPGMARTAGALRHRTEEITEHVLTELARAGGTSVPVTPVAADDITLWLSVLAGEVPPGSLKAALTTRVAAHARAELRPEDSLALHHTCAAVLRRFVTAPAGPAARRGALESPFNATALHVLGLLNTAVIEEHRTRRARDGHIGRREAAATPPDRPAPPPRWCLATLHADGGGKESLRRFRAANPDALVAVIGNRVTAFTHHRPAAAEVFTPYALVPIEDGDTTRAARKAALAAVIARHYEVSLDTEHTLPLTTLLDLPSADREAFVNSCLGPLHDSARYRHLLDTLTAYLAHNLRTTAAARSLYVHRHTFTYRLRSIHALTGLDLEKPFDRLRAELALILSRTEAPWPTPHRRAA